MAISGTPSRRWRKTSKVSSRQMSSLILIEAQPGVTTITLNRTDRRNALNLAMLQELCAALENIAKDSSVRSLILRGAGIDFSSGFDLTEGQEVETSLQHGELLCRAMLLLAEAPQFTIAMVAGYALAGGGALVAACDYAICLEDARFGYPVLKVGIVPTPGMPFLRHELKDRDFHALVLTGEMIEGKRAYEIGLVNQLVKSVDEAMEEAYRLAARIVESSPAAVAATKKFANALNRGNLRKEMDDALEVYKEIRRGPEAAEGMKAFAEKRPPVWNA
jgi:enoyl-CoA hydratase/carnithine racemase